MTPKRICLCSCSGICRFNALPDGTTLKVIGDSSMNDDHVYATLTVTGIGTGVEELPADSVEGKCHDLQGRPVQGRPAPGSIVVCNGRKILVK